MPPLAATVAVSGSGRTCNRRLRCRWTLPPSPPVAAAGRTSRGGALSQGRIPGHRRRPLAAAPGHARHCRRRRRHRHPMSLCAVAVGRACRHHQQLPPPTPGALPGGALFSPGHTSDNRCRPLCSCRLTHLPLPQTPSISTIDHRRCAAAYHGRPGPPAVTTVGGGGAWDQVHPGQDGRDPRSAFPDRPPGRDSAHDGRAHGPGAACLPLASRVGGSALPRPGARHTHRRQHGRKGTSHALSLLCPRQCLLHIVPSLRLPVQAAHQGPPPGDGDLT